MDVVKQVVVSVFQWIFSHKKLVFIYIPLITFLIITLYVGFIYVSWLGDKADALDKLTRYKRLIDRTQEIREGYQYSLREAGLGAKVVDIPTRIYDRNDEIIGEFFEQKREIVPYNYIPKYLIRAVVASEDRDFYQHNGVNIKGIFRAMIVNVLHFRVVQGGSTITQQLAKVLFTDMERTLKRKIYEMFCALEIENGYDKDDIMLMYLNLIYFGNGAYGVESAAKMFFGKSVRELNEVECAMVVATISNPLIYSPLSNLENSIRKTRRILQSMIDAGFINMPKAEYKYKKFLIKWDVAFNSEGRAESSLIGTFLYSSYRINRAPFFNEQIRRVMVEKFGEDVVKRGGLKIYTTIDGRKQDAAVRALRNGIENQRKYMIRRYGKKIEKDIDNIQGALIALDPFTGEIIAYAGGYKFTSKNQHDHVSQIRRQPGSSFKPLIYVSAIEAKDITPSTVFKDEPTTFPGNYRPGNYGEQYHGNVIVRYALARSLNVIAVKILQKTGYDRLFDIIQKSLDLSDSEMRERFGRTLSIALGTYEISPLESSVLHSVICNGGDFIKPYGIKFVKDYSGNIIWNNEEDIRRLIEDKRQRFGKIIDPVATAIMVNLMQAVFMDGGTAYFNVSRNPLGFPIAGKTGTTSNFSDAWLAGYTANMVTSVWIGNKKGAISLGSGRAAAVLAAPIWIQFLREAYRDEKPGNFKVPGKGISRQSICLESGLVPHETSLCPKIVHDQLYYSGTEPGEYCPLHVPKQNPEPDKSTVQHVQQ